MRRHESEALKGRNNGNKPDAATYFPQVRASISLDFFPAAL
jgi:hypothetical protein